jgi:Kae1-associated kinase Bud32
MKQEIFHGAEAVIYKSKNKIIKERIPKNYRIKQIDEKLRKFRTKREANLLKKSHFLYVPKVFNIDDKKMLIEMEFIKGKLLKDFIKENKNSEIFELIGVKIAKMHDNNIIHGDLTTTNIIIKATGPYFIDFGLGFISNKIEDKAVDLYLLKQALTSSFPLVSDKIFNKILEGYKPSKYHKEVFERLKKVEKRGHYKNAE